MYDIDKLSDIVNQLRAAKERVAELEGDLRALVNNGNEVVEREESPVGAFLSTGSRIEYLLNSEPTKVFTFREIFNAIGGNEPYIRSLLSRMVHDGKITKRGWGEYVGKQQEAQSR